MRILVIGSGGREHALVRALRTDDVHAAPGNPGIAALAETYPDTALSPAGILALARKLSPDLVVIGPEAPLVAGVADYFLDRGLAVFGPTAAAAHTATSATTGRDSRARRLRSQAR